MPQWNSRLLSADHPSATSGTRANMESSLSGLHPVGHRRGASQLSEADVLQNAYNIPVLCSRETNANAKQNQDGQRPSRHGRSMSHPFPSIFAGKKKRDGESSAMTHEVPYCVESLAQSSQSPAKPTSNKSASAADRDLRTGKCMTCDSTVRWPRELKVFRCTVCLTINDLASVSFKGRRGGESLSSSHVAHEPEGSSSHGGQTDDRISLSRTSELIENCIATYLLTGLRSDNETGTGRSRMAIPRKPLAPRSTCDSDLYAEAETLDGQPSGGASASRCISKPTEIDSDRIDGYISSRGNFGVGPGSAEKKWSPRGQSPSLSFEVSVRTPPQFVGAGEAGHGGNSQWRSTEDRRHEQKGIFESLEDYIVNVFRTHSSINQSFSSQKPNFTARAASEGANEPKSIAADVRRPRTEDIISPLDEKTLLIGDFAENGAWWTGDRDGLQVPDRSRSYRNIAPHGKPGLMAEMVTSRSPKVDWYEVEHWYEMVIHAGRGWEKIAERLLKESSATLSRPSIHDANGIRERLAEAQSHTRRVLLKATETLLKRPGGTLTEPGDTRFLLIILANPLLYPDAPPDAIRTGTHSLSQSAVGHAPHTKEVGDPQLPRFRPTDARSQRHTADHGPGKHSGIIKRVLGLLSNLPNECHHHLVSWFSRYSEPHFRRTAELVGSFVTYRLTRQHGRRRGDNIDPTGGLIPDVSTTGHGSSAALHAALGRSGQRTKASPDGKKKPVVYNDDWQIKAAARVMALLFAANNSSRTRHYESRRHPSADWSRSGSSAKREQAYRGGQMLTTSDFYNTLLDYSDLIADFEAWESSRGKFSFCQYPFFLSIWAKIQIMEHDARRQMEVKARQAFFDSIMTHKSVNQYLVLKVRRECLVEDSLKGVSEVVGSGTEDIKKGLRIEFKGEEGVDAGGLRKEWFLLLVRDVFNPEHGMFTYDEESQVCYFNPNSFETSDQFFLVGVVLGLAIYNSTILDVALPPFAFRKLLAAGPSALPGAPSHAKPTMVYTLHDLAEYRPSLARGLRQLLEFEGNVEETFCRDFVADVERYGHIQQVPLCPEGENRLVTNSNRKEFVDLYVRYLLDTAVIRQFEPFKRGFFTVCGGNALSLFRPEEIELLVRGSDEALDISSLQAVAIYENWGVAKPAETEPVVQWFWQSFRNAQPKDQRKLLSFITGSDRIPAMGAANLVIKLSCLGDDGMRFPVARTCFNMLSLWRYGSRQKLERMLWRAVNESEGFGLK